MPILQGQRNILPIDVFLQKALGKLIKVNFRKKSPVVLVNGLAEQYESWFFNMTPLGEHFVVHCPNLFLYDSDAYLKELQQVSVDWVVNRLKQYLDSFAQTPPYHLVGSSAGCQAIVTYASKYPETISRLVLVCPSGLGGDENLPVIEGVSKRDLSSMISAIFYDKKNFVIDEIVQVLKERFENKKWRLGFVRMAQVTKKNSIVKDLLQLKCPVLFICGEEDSIIPIWQAYQAARQMRDHHLDLQMIVIPKCGHAPQIEYSQIVNKDIAHFLNGRKFSKNPEEERFWRRENGILAPFDLDKALERALLSRK